MTDKKMSDAALTFVEQIKSSPEHREYAVALNEIKKQPELFRDVNEFRLKNFQVQSEFDGEELLERMEELQRESELLKNHPLVGSFLEAETAFCKMMQEVNMLIMMELDFE